MTEPGKYPRRHRVGDLRQFAGWEKNARKIELKDDDILYLQADLTVTRTPTAGDQIIFDKVTDVWERFCAELESE